MIDLKTKIYTALSCFVLCSIIMSVVSSAYSVDVYTVNGDTALPIEAKCIMYDNNGIAIKTNDTDINGYAEFKNIVKGNYVVKCWANITINADKYSYYGEETLYVNNNETYVVVQMLETAEWEEANEQSLAEKAEDYGYFAIALWTMMGFLVLLILIGIFWK